jgi:hypothetical protein
MGRSMMDYDFMRAFVTENYCQYDDHARGIHAWLRRPDGGCASMAGEATDTGPEKLPLKLYRGVQSPPLPGDLEARAPHQESLTVANPAGVRDAELRGYEEEPPTSYEPGEVFTRPRPGTVPLRLYYDRRRGDSVTTTSYYGKSSGKEYPFVRIEGYIYQKPQPETLMLGLYYNARSHDHLTTARPDIAVRAEEEGYVLQRIEGYVPRD